MRYADNFNNSNSVIDLIFLCLDSSKINKHIIISEFRYLFDYIPLIIDISICKEFIQEKQKTIIRNF